MSMISVIVPVYNVGQYLAECLDSIINQTYSNFEIILINDGSTDNSLKICESYATLDSRIVVINQQNAGLSAARNTGIEKSVGDYITFVDSDDLLHPEFLKSLFEAIDNSEVAICDYLEFSDERSILRHSDISGEVGERYAGREMNFYLYDIKKQLFVIVAWGKLYKRELWSDLRFPVGRLHEDEFVNYRIYSQIQSAVIVNTKLYYYRVRSGSITKSRTLRNVLDSYKAFKERAAFFAGKGDVELMQKAHNAQMAVLLRPEIKNQHPLLATLSVSDILKDDLGIKVKLSLVFKKIFPDFYNFLKKGR